MKDIAWKLSILGDAAKYDASCASSGSTGRGTAAAPGGVGSAAPSGICHAWGTDGRCISLLKVLLTNVCVYDCAYCINRRSNDVPRVSFSVTELVDLTIGFYRRNYIEGLFLSSGIAGDPDHTMARMLAVVKNLRSERGFNGYIHVKAIPGASARLIQETGYYADRMSVNIELPSEESLRILAPEKSRSSVLGPMALMDDLSLSGGGKRLPSPYRIDERAPDMVRDYPVPYRPSRSAHPFIPAGQSTQMIVGASPESDSRIIRLAEGLYRRFGLKRVYYSAYIPVNCDPRLPGAGKPPLKREHRLYQADWLLRFYRFRAEELFSGDRGNLEEDLDPKTAWALANYGLYPVDMRKADYDTLLRVPGIGVISARRIMDARRAGGLNFDALKKTGVVMKRAKFFITCGGRAYEPFPDNPLVLRNLLTDAPLPTLPGRSSQLELPF
ncbi:MAG: putative DNA modification/repair radical SAM protein [Spirochaetales bacterium]|nr:putative DNA modification/repair radical SAM protein [Spirochaetales bacterium]